jgi:hypothetical protein
MMPIPKVSSYLPASGKKFTTRDVRSEARMKPRLSKAKHASLLPLSKANHGSHLPPDQAHRGELDLIPHDQDRADYRLMARPESSVVTEHLRLIAKDDRADYLGRVVQNVPESGTKSTTPPVQTRAEKEAATAGATAC